MAQEPDPGKDSLESLVAEVQARSNGALPSSLEARLASGASLSAQPPAARDAPTMGRLKKLSYTHDSMIDLVITNPGLSQQQIAAHFGYSPAWISNVMASDAFQARLAARREEVIDPVIRATMEERVKALVLRSIEVLQEKLEKPAVSDTVALRAFELGAKAMGMGGNAPPRATPVDLDRLAERLISLNPGHSRPRLEYVIDAEVQVVNS